MLKVTASLLFTALVSSQSATKSEPDFYLRLKPEKDVFLIGEKIMLKLTVQSAADIFTIGGDRNISCTPYRVYVTQLGAGEPEKTEYYRHRLGDVRAGDGPDLADNCMGGALLTNGHSVTQTYDLTHLYHLTKPGKYTASVSIADQASTGSIWVDSNTVTLTIAPAK